MKNYKIIWHKGLGTHTVIITARNKREALQKAWSMFDAYRVAGVEVFKDEEKSTDD